MSEWQRNLIGVADLILWGLLLLWLIAIPPAYPGWLAVALLCARIALVCAALPLFWEAER